MGDLCIVSMFVDSQNPADVFWCCGLRHIPQFGFGGPVTLAGDMAVHIAVIAGEYLAVSPLHVTPVRGSDLWWWWNWII